MLEARLRVRLVCAAACPATRSAWQTGRQRLQSQFSQCWALSSAVPMFAVNTCPPATLSSPCPVTGSQVPQNYLLALRCISPGKSSRFNSLLPRGSRSRFCLGKVVARPTALLLHTPFAPLLHGTCTAATPHHLNCQAAEDWPCFYWLFLKDLHLTPHLPQLSTGHCVAKSRASS